jgi:hypothetical protein
VNHGHQGRRRGASQRICDIFNKIIAENFPNLESCPFRYRKPSGHHKGFTKIEPLHGILLKKKKASTENRERILKAVREKNQIIYKGKPIKITDFSTETLKIWY